MMIEGFVDKKTASPGAASIAAKLTSEARRISLACFFVVCMLMLQSSLSEAAGIIVGTVTRAEGMVDILRGGVPPAKSAKAGDSVMSNDLIRTKSNSSAEISFNDGNVLRLAQRTRIDVGEYTVGIKAKVKLGRGRAEAVVAKKNVERIGASAGAHRFEMHTVNAVAGVRGTHFFMSHERGATDVVVKEGTVYTYNQGNPDKMVDVPAGMGTSIHNDLPPAKPMPVSEADMKRMESEMTPQTQGGGKKEGASGGGSSGRTHGGAWAAGFRDAGSSGGDESGYGYGVPSEDSTGFSVGFTETPTSMTQAPSVDAMADIVAGYVAVKPKIIAAPPSVCNSHDAYFGFSSYDGITYTYVLDGGLPVSAGSSGITLTGLSEGEHTLSVAAVDSMGNVTALTYTWTTDYTAPSVIVSGASDSGKQSFIVNFSSAEQSEYSYRMDGGSWTSTTGAVSLAGLSTGNHTLDYSATDSAGNTSTGSISVSLSGYSVAASDSTYLTGGSLLNSTSNLSGYTEDRLKLDTEDWGIWNNSVGAYYSGSPVENSWDWDITRHDSSYRYVEGFGISGGQWSNNSLTGKASGFWADINGTPSTGIMIGETTGTFNPADYSWQAAGSGVWMDTGRLLSMACPSGVCSTTGTGLTDDQKKLQGVNIPVVEVGRTDLSGSVVSGGSSSIDYMSVYLNNVIFFSSATATKPTIWATNSVSGDYSFGSYLNSSNITDSANSITLSNGSGLSAQLQIRNWSASDSRWLATISNGNGSLSGGSYSGTVTFGGAAAGTFTSTSSGGKTTGTMSGTAAGIVK